MRAPDISFHTRSGFRSARIHLRADVLALYFEDEGRSVKTLEAEGNVQVRLLTGDASKDPVGFAESATYDAASESLLLGGWPEVRLENEKVTSDSPSMLFALSRDGIRKIEPGATAQRQSRSTTPKLLTRGLSPKKDRQTSAPLPNRSRVLREGAD
ncbi:MAG: hypothetical protein ACR2OZ_17675 [Verrucomicrobiales bacterium]